MICYEFQVQVRAALQGSRNKMMICKISSPQPRVVPVRSGEIEHSGSCDEVMMDLMAELSTSIDRPLKLMSSTLDVRRINCKASTTVWSMTILLTGAYIRIHRLIDKNTYCNSLYIGKIASEFVRRKINATEFLIRPMSIGIIYLQFTADSCTVSVCNRPALIFQIIM